MLINDFNRARLLVEQRMSLQGQIRLVVEGRHRTVGVTIQGYYQDDAMLARVRPVVLQELTQRLARVEDELRGMGVVVDEPERAAAGGSVGLCA